MLEQQINGVENMDFITSNSSSDGVSSISVSFDSGTDGNINQVNVQNRVSLAEPQLPEEVRRSGVSVNKASNSILPIGTASPTAAVVAEGLTRAIKEATPKGGFSMQRVMVPVQVITVG